MPKIEFRTPSCRFLWNLKSSLGSHCVCLMAGDLGKVLVDWNFPLNLHLLRGIPLKGQIVGLEVSFWSACGFGHCVTWTVHVFRRSQLSSALRRSLPSVLIPQSMNAMDSLSQNSPLKVLG